MMVHCLHGASSHLAGNGKCRVASCPCPGIPGATARPTISSSGVEAVRRLASQGQIVVVYPAGLGMADLRLLMARTGLGLVKGTDNEPTITAVAWLPDEGTEWIEPSDTENQTETPEGEPT